MYAAILSIIVFSVLFIELLERLEVTLFRPEKRAALMNAASRCARPNTRRRRCVEVRGVSKIYPGGGRRRSTASSSIFRAAS